MFSNLHSSLAPAKVRRSPSKYPYSSTENLAVIGSSPNGSDKKRRDPLSPSPMEPQSHGKSNAGFRIVSAKSAVASGDPVPIKVVEGKIPPLPLPDYDSLFPQKRHGVQGQTRWDHIIAEVNQRLQEYVPRLIGKEMSVDGPDLDSPGPPHNDKYSYLQERAAEHLHQQQTQVQKVQSTSLRSVGPSSLPALTPPSKPVAAVPLRLVVDSNQDQRTIQANPSEAPNAFVSKVLVSTKPLVQKRDLPSVTPREDAKKVINTSFATASDGKPVFSTEKHRPTSRVVLVSSSTDEPKGLPNTPKEIPATKPRQRLVRKEPLRPADHEQTLAGSTTVEQENRLERRASTLDIMRRSSPVTAKNTEVTAYNEKQLLFDSAESDIDKKTQLEHIMKAKFTELDPFPIADILPKDPWAQPEPSHSGDYLFTGEPQKNRKLKEQAMTTDDLDKLFAPNNPTDPFASFNYGDSDEPREQEKTEEHSPAFQRGFSQIKKKQGAPQPSANSSNKAVIGKIELVKQNPSPIEDKLIISAATTGCVKLAPQNTRQSKLYGRDGVESQDKWAVDPFTSSSHVPSVLTSPEPPQSVVGELTSQTGEKTPLRAWVSPSEVQPLTVLSSNGGGPVSTPRRPHPVKPMSSIESQAPISTPVVGEMLTYDRTLGKMKAPGMVESGPYTQLTQEELITLVVKQQTELSKKDSKIVELEEYIDNLLVRVIEEKPSILLGLNSVKQAL